MSQNQKVLLGVGIIRQRAYHEKHTTSQGILFTLRTDSATCFEQFASHEFGVLSICIRSDLERGMIMYKVNDWESLVLVGALKY